MNFLNYKGLQFFLLRLLVFFLIISLLSFFIVSHYRQSNWKREIWIAMDTFIEIQLPPKQYTPELKKAIEQLILSIDQSLNVYHENSEIMQLNQKAFIAPVKLSDTLWEILSVCLAFSEQSLGLFDVTFQPLQDAYGFHSGNLVIPEEKTIKTLLEEIGYQHLVLNPQEKTIFFLHDRIKLNLSSLIKGYALDRIADYLEQQGIHYYILNFGGSIKLKHYQPLEVHVQHPRIRSSAGKILLSSGNISTSSDNQQYFEKDGLRYSHIVNPMTGKTQNPFQSLSVQHPTSAMLADMLSTTLILMDHELMHQWMQEHYPEAGYLGIHEQGILSNNLNWTLP